MRGTTLHLSSVRRVSLSLVPPDLVIRDSSVAGLRRPIVRRFAARRKPPKAWAGRQAAQGPRSAAPRPQPAGTPPWHWLVALNRALSRQFPRGIEGQNLNLMADKGLPADLARLPARLRRPARVQRWRLKVRNGSRPACRGPFIARPLDGLQQSKPARNVRFARTCSRAEARPLKGRV
jgi:hypothetical protein